jgi:Glycosyl transferase family 2
MEHREPKSTPAAENFGRAGANGPLISVVTPSYNQGRFIEETLRSVAAQDYPEVEHLVVDGGSTDGTVEILERYEGTYRMRWTSEADEGQADALRKGFALCRGDIVCWLNSDDVYLSDSVLSRVAGLFRSRPATGVVTGGGAMLSADGRRGRRIVIRRKLINRKGLRWSDQVLQPATFFKREVLRRVTLDTSLHYAFDWDLFIQMADVAEFLVVNEPWAGYRMWGENKTSAGGAKRAQELVEIARRYCGRASLQYGTSAMFSILFSIAGVLPHGARSRAEDFLRKASGLVQTMTLYRTTRF